MTRIFTGSKDGWKTKDFHRLCDMKGPTLTLIRSSEKFLSAGFTSRSWKSFGGSIWDSSAMVFALTNNFQVFKPNLPEFAVGHDEGYGPLF